MVQQQHIEDEEKFRKIQIMDQNNFQEKLEGLQVGPVEGSSRTRSPPHMCSGPRPGFLYAGGAMATFGG